MEVADAQLGSALDRGNLVGPAKPKAALVYATTLHVTDRLAWVVQLAGMRRLAGGPVGGTLHPYVATGQWVIDATNGERLLSATF